MQRVAVIDPSGAGKSTLARELGHILGVEVIHLDAHFWRPGWVQAPREEFDAVARHLAEQDAWIIDGNFSRTLGQRLDRANAIVILDMTRAHCMRSVLKRRWTYRGQSRPDIGQGCKEKVDLEFLKWVWDYPKKHWPEVRGMALRYQDVKPVYILRSHVEIQRFLDNARMRHTSQASANR